MVLSGLVDAEARYKELDDNEVGDRFRRVNNMDVATLANGTTEAYCRLVTLGPFSLFTPSEDEEELEVVEEDQFGQLQHHHEHPHEHHRIAFPGGDSLRHMAAVALALSHLNAGDGTVVPELAGLPDRCDVRFTSEFVDTAFRQSQAAASVLAIMDRPKALPCAFVGGLRSSVTSIVATLTTLRGYPQISPLSKDPALSFSDHDSDQQFRYLARLSPSLDDGDGHGNSQRPDPLLKYLQDEYDVQRLIVAYKEDDFTNAITHALVRNAGQFFPQMKITIIAVSPQMESHQVEVFMQSIRAASFRYIYALFSGAEYEHIFAAAVQEGIAGMASNYTWIWSDVNVESYLKKGQTFDIESIKPSSSSSSSNSSSVASSPSTTVFQAMVGSLLYSRIGSAPGMGRYDAFVKEWERLGESEDDLEYLRSKIPRFPKDLRYRPNLDRSVFATDSPNFSFTALYYDAAIAMGLAACKSQGSNNTSGSRIISNNSSSNTKSSNNTQAKMGQSPPLPSLPTGPQHFEALVRTSFVGASGIVLFDRRMRAENTSSYRLWNFAPKRAQNLTVTLKKVELAAYESGGWTKAMGSPYTFFANGKPTIPPDLSVADENKNFIGTKLRLVGYFLAAIIVFLSFAFSKWTLVSRDERIVRASQPIFLHLICLGTGLMGASIAVMGLDDETIGNMDAVCSSAPALLWLGWCFAFSAILSKTLRINMIFHNPRFRRIRVTSGDVMRPMCLMLCANVVLFVARAVFDPLRWKRTVILRDEYGRVTESVGECARRTPAFFYAVVIINVGVVAVASYQSYIARKISTEFSESEYIAKAVAVVLVVSFMAIPLYFVAEESTKSQFLAKASAVFVVSLSLLLLIFVPKMCYRGEGVSAGIRKSVVSVEAGAKTISDRSIDAASRKSQMSDYTGSDDMEDGVRIVDHPKINSQLATKLRISRKQITMLKRMVRNLRRDMAASQPRDVELYQGPPNDDEGNYDVEDDDINEDDAHSISLLVSQLPGEDEAENNAAASADSMHSSAMHVVLPNQLKRRSSSSMSSLSHHGDDQQTKGERLVSSFKALQHLAESPKAFLSAAAMSGNKPKRKSSLPLFTKQLSGRLSRQLSWHHRRSPAVSKDLLMSTTVENPTAALATSAPCGRQLEVVDDHDYDNDDNDDDEDGDDDNDDDDDDEDDDDDDDEDVDDSLSSASSAASLPNGLRRSKSEPGAIYTLT
jgi:hypothetical protein